MIGKNEQAGRKAGEPAGRRMGKHKGLESLEITALRAACNWRRSDEKEIASKRQTDAEVRGAAVRSLSWHTRKMREAVDAYMCQASKPP